MAFRKKGTSGLPCVLFYNQGKQTRLSESLNLLDILL